MPVSKGQRFGGRKRGTKNKATLLKDQERADIVAAATAEGETPLEYMLRVMRTSTDTKRCDAMAIAAAPFVHPKLAAVEHSGDKECPIAIQMISGVPRAVASEDEASQSVNGHPSH